MPVISRLVQGAFAFVSGLVASTGGLNIETPVANIGIRGTVGGATCAAAGRCEFYAAPEIVPVQDRSAEHVHAPDRRSIRQRPVCRRNSGRDGDRWGGGQRRRCRRRRAAASDVRPGCGRGSGAGGDLAQQLVQFYPQVFVPTPPAAHSSSNSQQQQHSNSNRIRNRSKRRHHRHQALLAVPRPPLRFSTTVIPIPNRRWRTCSSQLKKLLRFRYRRRRTPARRQK